MNQLANSPSVSPHLDQQVLQIDEYSYDADSFDFQREIRESDSEQLREFWLEQIQFNWVTIKVAFSESRLF